MKKEKLVCGSCLEVQKSRKAYLDHVCEATGFTPTEPKHFGKHFEKIQLSAINRGQEKQGKPKYKKLEDLESS